MSDDGCVVALCAGIPGPIVAEPLGDKRRARCARTRMERLPAQIGRRQLPSSIRRIRKIELRIR